MNTPNQVRFIRNRAPAALLAALLAAASLSAAVYTWDPANTGNGATIDAGSGTWDVESTNAIWNDAGANVAWAQTSSTVGLHSAIFGGADAIAGSPYIVTLGSSVATVTSVRFNNSGYVLTAATGSSPVLNTPQIFTATNKSATISGPVSVRFSGTSHFAGYGILTVKDGASLALTTGGNLGFGSGTRVVVEAGGDIASSAAILVGSTNYDGSTSRVTVNGGSLRATGTGANIVLINSASLSADTTSLSTVLTLTSGVISNAAPGGGVRFGGANSSISSAISGTIHLDGGVLTTARVYEGSGTAVTGYNSTFNFNGGTLQALSNTTVGGTFLRFLNNAFVKAGGAFIDTNGATITIAQPLITDATSLGGGLTKLGAGVLTLTGANTYTGPTNISAGTLNVDAPYSAITAATVSPSARLQITSGATASSLPAITLQGGSILGLNLGSYNASNLATAQVATLTLRGITTWISLAPIFRSAVIH